MPVGAYISRVSILVSAPVCTGGLVEVEVLASGRQAFVEDLKVYRALYGCVDIAKAPHSGDFEPSLTQVSITLQKAEHASPTAAICDSVVSTSALLVRCASHQVLVPALQISTLLILKSGKCIYRQSTESARQC